ncbi:MAG: hypothetical protein Q9174_002356, partial [Haloplaca sp. 1 TL-2023]
HWESIIIEGIRNLLEIPFGPISQKEPAVESNNIGGEAEEYPVVESDSKDMAVAAYDHGYKEAEKQNTGDSASIWTELALAYAIHKSFIFIRVPITAAITPKVVKVLRGWGWDIGKRRPKGSP